MTQQGRQRAGLPDGVLSGAGPTEQPYREAAVSKSDPVVVSREVLDTMLNRLREIESHLDRSWNLPLRESCSAVQAAQTRVQDVVIAVEALCARQS